LPLALACRLRLAGLKELGELRGDAYTILVTRQWPVGLTDGAVDDWWPTLAPSLRLLHAPRPASDPPRSAYCFASRYLAELDALAPDVQQRYLVRLGLLLRRQPTVTLVSCERARVLQDGRAPTQREIVRAWFLGEDPCYRKRPA